MALNWHSPYRNSLNRMAPNPIVKTAISLDGHGVQPCPTPKPSPRQCLPLLVGLVPVLALPALVAAAGLDPTAASAADISAAPGHGSGGPAIAPQPTVLPMGTDRAAPTERPGAKQQTTLPTLAQAPDPAPQSPANTVPAPQPPSPWASTLELYGFLPLQTQTGLDVGNRSTSFDVGLGTLLSQLKWASSARGSLEYGRLGLLGDVRYNRLGSIASRTGPKGLVRLQAETSLNATVADMALRYRFGSREAAQGKPGDFSIIPYAGVRIIDTNFDVTSTINVLRFERQVSRDLSHTWVQALLGTQATVFLAPRLRLFGRADLGGFGSGSSDNLSGNAQLGLGYALGSNTDLNLSWRYQGMSWNNGESGRGQRGISSDENGFEIGLKFFF